MNQKVFINAKQAEELYGIDAGTLANLRHAKQGPKYYKRGRSAIYKVEEFEAWLTRCPVKTVEQN